MALLKGLLAFFPQIKLYLFFVGVSQANSSNAGILVACFPLIASEGLPFVSACGGALGGQCLRSW